MGRTKALVEVEGRPMGLRVLDALRSAGCAPVVVVGGDPDELKALAVPVLPDLHPGAGPVGAVITALDHLGSEAGHVAVVACDLADLDGATVARLVDAAGDEVVVARSDRLEPLCAVWPVGLLGAVEDAFADGIRAMHVLLGRLGAVEVTVDPQALRNINRPDDLGR